jgi:hypothetical protein
MGVCVLPQGNTKNVEIDLVQHYKKKARVIIKQYMKEWASLPDSVDLSSFQSALDHFFILNKK